MFQKLLLMVVTLILRLSSVVPLMVPSGRPSYFAGLPTDLTSVLYVRNDRLVADNSPVTVS